MSIEKLIVYNPVNLTGEKLNLTYQLNLKIVENSGNYLIHKDIIRHFTKEKQRTASSKTRSSVRGGGCKPWKQKGTGRARAGSNRSPLWKGGGVIFGPNSQIKEYKLNKKERKLTLQTLIYNKKANILLIENLENNFDTSRTKKFYEICQKCGINLKNRSLLVVSNKTFNLKLAVQNIKNIELICASQLNTLSLIKAKQIIITSDAFNELKEIFHE
jgi:large subunit ribosomal protein L4